MFSVTSKMKFIYLFVIFCYCIILSAGSPLCPARCVCTGKVVRCIHRDLTAVPKVPADSHILDLRYNQIRDMAPGIFSNLRHLLTLMLNNNRLTTLRDGSFDGLKRLRNLYLYRNQIHQIDANVFQGLHHLQQLYLHVNEIHEFEADTFSNMPKLEKLYLQNNRIEHIPLHTFKGMNRLRKLRLDSNALACDCSMLWMVKMLGEHSNMRVEATCYTPDLMTGTTLASMNEDDFHCQAPIIMAEPEDLVVNYGDEATLSCSVIGEPAPEIVWLRDSNEIASGDPRYTVVDNGTLIINKLDESDAGFFECMAKNPVGEVRSRPARMIVQESVDHSGAPVFSLLPKNQVLLEGDTASLDCVAIGNPKPYIAWYRGGERLLLSDRMIMHHNGTVVIDRITRSDAGVYSCYAESIQGIITASAVISVEAPPSLLEVPSDKTVIQGNTVEYVCRAQATPPAVFTWYKDFLALAPSENIIFSDSSRHLTIHQATVNDSGTYHCRAENTVGFTEASAKLDVREDIDEAPKLSVTPGDTEAFRDTSIQLPCQAKGSPTPKVEWRKDGSRIEVNYRIHINSMGTLLLNNLTIQDTGRYDCSAINRAGSDSSTAFITVKDTQLSGGKYINIAVTQATRDVDQAINNTMKQLFSRNQTEIDVSDLFRIIRFPNAGAREIARAAEIYDRTLTNIRSFITAGLDVKATERFRYQDVLSPEHLNLIARLSGCSVHRNNKDCSDICYHNKYRSIDGSCNNLIESMWGSSLTPFRRVLSPIYENGFSQPIGWNEKKIYNGFVLPSARLISTTVISTEKITPDEEITHMTMQWGQWLDHDLDHSLPSVSSQTWDGIDCKKSCEFAAPCFPIGIPPTDPRISNRRCIDFVRTSSVCGSGMTSVLFGKIQPREQINQLTSFIDASHVYGYESDVADDLRNLTSDDGLLRSGFTFPKQKELLPSTGKYAMDCRRDPAESDINCFVAGDIRANEQVGLTAMHTIWFREHNRIAGSLKKVNPFWDGDILYQEARKIVGAQMQFITFEHWLPIILGPEGYNMLGQYQGYNYKLNPAISNVFATAALRFGHSLINPVFERLDENYEPIKQGPLPLNRAFFAPWRLVNEGGVDPLLRGMFTTPAKLKTPTQNLNTDLTEKLFESAHAVALDLAAINIQRGRDHGIPPYTQWREFCNMSKVDSFKDLENEISDEDVRNKLEELYGSPHNIDVWVGGILEDQVEGGKVGPLFRCLLIEQFQRLRDGDRFWYENPTTFKLEQILQIKKTSLARILCDNGDNIDTITEDVFYLPDSENDLQDCQDLPSIDLRFWTDCQTCDSDDTEQLRKRRSVPQDEAESADTVYPKESIERLNYLEQTQDKMMEIIEKLQDKIQYLEDNCVLK